MKLVVIFLCFISYLADVHAGLWNDTGLHIDASNYLFDITRLEENSTLISDSSDYSFENSSPIPLEELLAATKHKGQKQAHKHAIKSPAIKHKTKTTHPTKPTKKLVIHGSEPIYIHDSGCSNHYQLDRLEFEAATCSVNTKANIQHHCFALPDSYGEIKQTLFECTNSIMSGKKWDMKFNNGHFWPQSALLSTLQMRCKQHSDATLLSPYNCKGRKIVEIGFQPTYGNKNKFLPLISVLHEVLSDKHNNVIIKTYWSHHIIYGSVLEYREKNNGNPSFAAGQIIGPDGKSMERYNLRKNYEIEEQQQVFNSFGNNYIGDQASQLYLARGHLAPDGDFLYSTWQDATYFFVNVAPQWQIINNGNWKQMETKIRAYAMKEKKDIKVYTGTFGVLELRTVNGTMEAYLSNKLSNQVLHVPVPKFFWKVLQHGDSCIVLISTNNPYIGAIPNPGLALDDVHICQPEQTTSREAKDTPQGYIYSCDFKNFNTAAGAKISLPPLDCKKMMDFKI